jgi:hypothetical protein
LPQPSSIARLIGRLLPVSLPLGLLLVTGFLGLDFGRHWDEWLQMRSVSRAVEQELLLPDSYNYPSVSFWLTVAALAPEVLADPPTTRVELAALQERLLPQLMDQGFRLRVRGVFLVVSSLIVLWTYLAQLRWRGRVGEALLAATLIGLSFELAYHARWIAPDAVNAQFVALCTLLLICAWSAPRPRAWLLASAVSAGLATGTKYTAGLLLAPILIGLLGAVWAARRTPGADPGRAGVPLVPLQPSTLPIALLLFAATFLATTPGALLQPFSFFHDVRFEVRHYGYKGHYGYTVEAGLPHLLAQLRYLGGAALSPFEPLAWALAGLVLVGAGALVVESRRLALLLLVFPVLFVLYMSTTVVLFVRNLLLVLPFMALLGARGAGALGSLLPAAAGRHAALGLALLLLAVHGSWLAHAADTIRDRGQAPFAARFVGDFDRWLAAREPELVYVAPAVATALEAYSGRPRPNLSQDPGVPTRLAAFLPPRRTYVLENLPSNRPGSIVRAFGPLEVNLAYYWTWPEPRILVTERDYAQAHGLIPRVE